MSLQDQLIGWLETQEQLRKLVALLSEVKRVQCVKVTDWSFIPQISLSGIS